jgi:hypothetical protein
VVEVKDIENYPSGKARFYAWLAATLSVLSVAVFGAAIAVTVEQSELLILFGLVPWARFGAWLGLLAGLAVIIATVRAQREWALPPGSLLGFLATGTAAVSLSAFLLAWGLGPF